MTSDGSPVVGDAARRSPRIRIVSPYTSSATDACRSSSKAVRMSRRTRGRASVQRSLARHIMAALSDRCIHSTRPLAAGW